MLQENSPCSLVRVDAHASVGDYSGGGGGHTELFGCKLEHCGEGSGFRNLDFTERKTLI